MLKRLIIALLFAPVFAMAQSTATLPTPTTAYTPQFRYYGTAADTLKQIWVYSGSKYNRWYTATEINKLYGKSFNQKIDSIKAANNTWSGNNNFSGNTSLYTPTFYGDGAGNGGVAFKNVDGTTTMLYYGSGTGTNSGYLDFRGQFLSAKQLNSQTTLGIGVNTGIRITAPSFATINNVQFQQKDGIIALVGGAGSDTSVVNNYTPKITKSNIDSLNNWQISGASPSYSVSTEHSSEGILDPYSNTVYNFFRIGTDAGHLDNSGRIVMRKSTDNGKTYSAVTTIFNSSWDDRNISGSITSTGRIIVFIREYDYIGVAEKDWGYIYSDNGGTTWSSFTSLAPSLVPLGTIGYGKIIQANGKLLHITYTGNRISRLLQSTDNGSTWTILSTPYDFSSTLTKKVTEPAIAYIGSNKLIMVARNDDNGPYYQFKSSDNGSTWTDQGLTNTYNVPVGVRSACPAILYNASKDEVILFGIARSGITSQRYSDAMQVYVNKSADVFGSSLAWTQRSTLQRPVPNFRNLYGQPAVAALDNNTIIGTLTDGYQNDPTVDANKEFESLYSFVYNYTTDANSPPPAQVKGYRYFDGTSTTTLVPREGTYYNPLSQITSPINPGTFELTGEAGTGATTNIFQARSTNGTAYLWHATQAGNWFWDITPTSVLTTNNFLMVDATTKQQYIMAATGTGTPVKAISPTFTGTPAAPTAAAGTNSTQIATTAYVQNSVTTSMVKSYTAKTATYTALTSDYYIDCTANTFTVTLPTSVAGQTFVVANNGAGTITVQGTGGQLVNGAATYNIAAGSTYEFYGTGTQYRVKF